MYLGLRITRIIIRKQLSAHRHPPVPGFLSGKCRAAPITLRVIGAASFLPVYLYVSRTEFLIASNTSYLNVYKDASAFHTVFMRRLSLINV
jgi:hypothetical protein